MNYSSGFFNAELNNGVYDRVYAAEQYRDYLQALVKDGVIRGNLSELEVTVINRAANASIYLDSGFAAIKGGFFKHESKETFSNPVYYTTDGRLTRHDLVVLRFNATSSDVDGGGERSITPLILTGTPANDPADPAKYTSDTIYDLVLARLVVTWNSVTVIDLRSFAKYGEKGEKGDPGTAGAEIVDISETAKVDNVVTYTVTLSNGNTYDFYVTNGDVTSVNSRTGDVVLTASDVGALPTSTPYGYQVSILVNEPTAGGLMVNLYRADGTASAATIPPATASKDGCMAATDKAALDGALAKIPAQATDQNQLADKDFVNSSLNSITAFYITKNAAGDPFDTYAQLSSAQTFYSGGEQRIPTRNDYCVVLEDETHIKYLEHIGYTTFTQTSDYIGFYINQSGSYIEVTQANYTTLSIIPGTTIAYDGIKPTVRYIFQGVYGEGGQWEFQFIVNETALTAAQLAALNSGATAAAINQISLNTAAIADKASAPIVEQLQILTSDWQALSGNDTYSVYADITMQSAPGVNSIVTLANNNPSLFSEYGFVIANITGQTATVYAISAPDTTVTLTIILQEV